MTASRIPCFPRNLSVFFLAAPLCCFLCSLTLSTSAQTTDLAALPDAPTQQTPSSGSTGPQQGSPTPAQPNAQTQTPNAQPSATPSKQDQQRQSEEELKKEEHQRILGVVPNFNTTDNQNALPLTPKQKFDLDFHSSVDPFVFLFAGLDAAEEQAEDTFPEYGQGAAGYGKRIGASYADTFDGNLWGNAILPILFHEDPRYFRKGTGTFTSRFLYSASTTVWCKRDSGRWGPNYANVGGNFVAGGISNIYYPESDRGFSLTVTRALTVTAEGVIGSEFVEFWPDISQHLFHKKDRSLTAPAGTPASGVPPQTAPETSKPVQPASPSQSNSPQ